MEPMFATALPHGKGKVPFTTRANESSFQGSEIRGTNQEKQRQVVRYKHLLTPGRLSKTDLTKGHATLSLMPEGLLEGPGNDQAADLIAYLMSGR